MAQTMRDPPGDIEVPTQSDSANISEFRCIMVGVSGNVKITTHNDQDVVLPSLASGVWHPVLAKRVWSTGTTATSLLVGR